MGTSYIFARHSTPDVILFQDPLARAVSFLGKFVPPAAGPFLDVPADWAWGDLLVVVVDVGGSGERDVVLDDVMLSVEVSHADSLRASEVARRLHGLLRQWPYEESGVRFLRTIQRPTFEPDDETRTPGYSFTVELSFRASTTTFSSL